MFEFPLTHYHTTNFRLFQTERVCRLKFQISQKWQKVIQMGRKHYGKRRNCSSRAISSFPTVFSKDLYCRHVKPGLVWERAKSWTCPSVNLMIILTKVRQGPTIIIFRINSKNMVSSTSVSGRNNLLLFLPQCFQKFHLQSSLINVRKGFHKLGKGLYPKGRNKI